jgi:hypothetical protein
MTFARLPEQPALREKYRRGCEARFGKAIRVWLQENADRTARAKLIRLADTFYFDFALLEVWEDSGG